VALVERVRVAAAEGAREGLGALAASVSAPIGCIALRLCPELPPTVEERIADNRSTGSRRSAGTLASPAATGDRSDVI
jgi:hypothetical protein